MSDLKELLAEYIQNIYINEDSMMINFSCTREDYIYRSYGDCCASIYFEDIEYPATKPEHGYRVYSVEIVEEYGYRIKTDVGDIVISGRYECNSGWGGYDVGCELYAIIPKDIHEEVWKHFKENGK